MSKITLVLLLLAFCKNRILFYLRKTGRGSQNPRGCHTHTRTHARTHTHIVGRPATTLKLSQRTRVSLGLKCSKFCPLFPPALPTEKISPLCLFYIFSYHSLIAIPICMLFLWINVSGT